MKEEDTQCTMHNAQWRQQDQNLREALRQEEAALPQMPADLNARLLQRMESEQPKYSRTLWRWMAAAASLLLLIGIGYTLLPQEQQNEPLIAQKTVEPQTETPKVEPEPQAEPQEETAPQQVKDSQSAPDGHKVLARRTKTKKVRLPQPIPETQEQTPSETQEPVPDVMSDPFLMAEMHAQQIRTRGMRLYEEIEQQIKN